MVLVSPLFLLQGLLLWVPLALYPPLAAHLKRRSASGGGPSKYFLEV